MQNNSVYIFIHFKQVGNIATCIIIFLNKNIGFYLQLKEIGFTYLDQNKLNIFLNKNKAILVLFFATFTCMKQYCCFFYTENKQCTQFFHKDLE